MKINKNDYIEAINEIKADENLKNKTIQKIIQHKNHTYSRTRKLLSMAAIFVLTLSFVYVGRNTTKNQQQQIDNITSEKLSTVGSYDNMKKICQKNEEHKKVYNKRYLYKDSIINSTEQSTETIKSDLVQKNDYSTTNVQVEGVDEADIVKNNGEYIFYYRSSKANISVIDAKNNKLIDTIEFDDVIPVNMYLKDDRLVVITSKRVKENSKTRNYNYKTSIKVFNYDISNIKNIKVVKEVETEGSLLESRMIGDYIYIISNKYIYSSMIEDEELLKPIYKDSDIGEQTNCIEFSEIQCFPNSTENVYMIVSSFNIKTDDAMNVQTYLGSGNEVYASTSNLYVICDSYVPASNFMRNQYTSYVNDTKVYKLNLDNGDVKYVATATVPGSIKNQFSMDEYNGYLRIATTHNSKETSYKEMNNLYILDEKLNLVGQIENLAPDEKIYSVRYMGDKAYMVTFEQVDPLFVIDLSDPTEPKVIGQLKMPGFSEYLHPYDETHLIGFGKDTEFDGKNVKEIGFKMSLFDVSDLSNPKELYSVKIGDSGTYSELLYNHKALLFSREKNIIAFPIAIRQKQNDSNYYSRTTFSGAIIYGLSLEDGFTQRARISSGSEFDIIDRIIYIGDKLYTLSEEYVKVIDMNTMKEITKIELYK